MKPLPVFLSVSSPDLVGDYFTISAAVDPIVDPLPDWKHQHADRRQCSQPPREGEPEELLGKNAQVQPHPFRCFLTVAR